MMGNAHMEMLRSCLAARARRDAKRIDHPLSAQRAAVIADCEMILSAFAVRLDADSVEIALTLGWEPQPVILGSLRLAAQEWLDARHADWQARTPTPQAEEK